MFGFGKKSSKNREVLEKEILENKIELRKLTEKLKLMLAKEIATARKLKEQGLKSSSNYSRIGISYYLLQAAQKAYSRMDDITSSAELSQMMQGLGDLVKVINGIGAKTEKPKASGLLAGIEKMQASQKAENDALAGMLKGLGASTAASSSNDISGLVGLDIIEGLINGSAPVTSDLPADAVPITASVQTQQPVVKTAEQPQTQESGYDEAENLRMLQQLINKL